MAIGVFDSGLGGLSVVRALRARFPRERIIYYGDTLHVPYGGRTPGELIHFADRITRFLLDEGAELIIDACNTTSALALDLLQEKYGHRAELIGVVEPGAARAAGLGRRRIGLLATEATVNSGVYQQKIFARSEALEVTAMACPRLVPFIEAGDTESYQLCDALGAYLDPLMQQEVDTLILGCTHYPFLQERIETRLPRPLHLVDPGAEAVTSIERYRGGDFGESLCYVSLDADAFRQKADRLLPGHGFTRFETRDVMEDWTCDE